MDEGLKINRKQREAVIAALEALRAISPSTVGVDVDRKYNEAIKIMAAPATTAPLYS